jgi:hypothetical protein
MRTNTQSSTVLSHSAGVNAGAVGMRINDRDINS